MSEDGRSVGGFRGKRLAIYERAAHLGIEPTPLDISRATGIPVRTVKRVVSQEEPISAVTIRRVLDRLGGTFDELFEPIPQSDDGQG